MAGRISRRILAAHTAEQLLAGNKDAISSLAAYLIESGRVDETDLILRDIEAALAANGTVVARVESARKLTAEAKKSIEEYVKTAVGATDVQIDTTVDESLLGGVKISVPGHELDATLKRKLNKLQAMKV